MLPKYDYGAEVRLTRNVRNDGTYPGKDVGTLLIRRGAVGCVYDVGTYLQDQLIYRVHFIDEGMTVGCREEELILATDEWIPNRFEFREKVISNRSFAINGEVIVSKGDTGEIQKVVRVPGEVFYHVRFGERTFQVPEASVEEPIEDDSSEALAMAANSSQQTSNTPAGEKHVQY